MAYISQEEKKAIAPAVKALLKQYGLKGTLSVCNHSTLVLTLTAGSIDFIEVYTRKNRERALSRGETPRELTSDYLDVNVYWIDEYFDGAAADFLKQAVAALKGQGWYDKSDIQTDYFNVKHYVDIRVGKWNNPYQLTA